MEVVTEPSLFSIDERREVIMDLFRTLPLEEKDKILKVFATPARTPAPEEIGKANISITWVQLDGVCRHGDVSWGYFEAIGSILILIQDEHIDFWIDCFPGEGKEARHDFLRGVIKLNWPNAVPLKSADTAN